MARVLVFFGFPVAGALHHIAAMNKNVLMLTCVLFSIPELTAEDRDAVVKKDEVSIHTVERGSMPIFVSASGTVTSLQPPRAVLNFDNDQGKCAAGHGARLVVGENLRSLAGKVVGRTDAGNCEVEFADALPQGAVTGVKVGGLIAADEIKDVVFFGGPAGSRPNSTATIFVLEGPSHAPRVTIWRNVRSSGSSKTWPRAWRQGDRDRYVEMG